MKKNQYTIRGVSERLDARIRELAAQEGKSINETVLQAISMGAGMTENHIRYVDLDDLAGTWTEDPEFDAAIQEMDRVDPELWKSESL
jgi:protein involved in polysaccharide export with SLBB domain